MTPHYFLFDLDGTILDSAPDLAGSANHMRCVRGLEPIDYALLRKTASSGARGLLGVAFGITPDTEGYDQMAAEFLDYYETHIADKTCFFPGITDLIREIEQARCPWGIVTNKHKRFTLPLLKKMGLNPNVVVCGDTLPQRKPSPEPILYAMKQIGAIASQTVYVGDDIRDIQAGRAAHCTTVAAAWGYLGSAEPIEQWQADHTLQNPMDILTIQLVTESR